MQIIMIVYKLKEKKLINAVVKIFFLLFLSILLAIILRIFFFATFKIPSSSMEPTLENGDYIIVNKLIPGARIIKDIGMPENSKKLHLRRLCGIRRIKRNDVIVFNFPNSDWDKDLYYVKRCVGLPGDSFYIDNGVYKVKGCNIILGNLNSQKKISDLSVNNFQQKIFYCFPKSNNFNWNIKHFGPLYIPRKGDYLNIDTTNIALYKRNIEYETGQKITIRNSQIYLNDSCINKYNFLTNYYFTTGDNVTNSRDSRYWGLLSEDYIVGKASIIWKSENIYNQKIRWERVLKSIN